MSDNQYAKNYSHLAYTPYLWATDFGFGIPGDATIVGILLQYEASTSVAFLSGAYVQESESLLIKGGSALPTNRSLAAIWTPTDVVYDRGSFSDLWGTTWTPGNINSTNFGAAVKAYSAEPGPDPLGVYYARVDSFSITVAYTASGGIFNRAFPGRRAGCRQAG
jgi:hypothetical protein